MKVNRNAPVFQVPPAAEARSRCEPGGLRIGARVRPRLGVRSGIFRVWVSSAQSSELWILKSGFLAGLGESGRDAYRSPGAPGPGGPTSTRPAGSAQAPGPGSPAPSARSAGRGLEPAFQAGLAAGAAGTAPAEMPRTRRGARDPAGRSKVGDSLGGRAGLEASVS